MYNFSQRSLNNLKNVDERLVKICNELIKRIDFTVIEGHRSLERQKELFDKGFSKIDGISKKGKHNYSPSLAIDIIPYKKGLNPFDGTKESEKMFNDLAVEFKKVAKELNIKIVWGGDWVSFRDLPHFQL
jgi:peptidoglycan L-alanyl-D-glutamate endopeptidase CwlK